jgi:hypothetical protein
VRELRLFAQLHRASATRSLALITTGHGDASLCIFPADDNVDACHIMLLQISAKL